MSELKCRSDTSPPIRQKFFGPKGGKILVGTCRSVTCNRACTTLLGNFPSNFARACAWFSSHPHHPLKEYQRLDQASPNPEPES